MRKVPNGGIGYGGLRYLKNAFGDIGNPEIVFNFLGTKTSTVPDHGIKTTTLTENLRDPRSERHYKLEINVHIIDDQLQGTCSYGNNIHTTDTIALLMNDFKKRIQEIGAYCSQTENGGYTPSDFSEAEISQDDLDSLLDLLQ
jgi:non-ribosomal peptide synthase protein (TIGR01720 family)